MQPVFSDCPVRQSRSPASNNRLGPIRWQVVRLVRETSAIALLVASSSIRYCRIGPAEPMAIPWAASWRMAFITIPAAEPTGAPLFVMLGEKLAVLQAVLG